VVSITARLGGDCVWQKNADLASVKCKVTWSDLYFYISYDSLCHVHAYWGHSR
jgi:hypothetical protein